jgi:hypothetical protein
VCIDIIYTYIYVYMLSVIYILYMYIVCVCVCVCVRVCMYIYIGHLDLALHYNDAVPYPQERILNSTFYSDSAYYIY